MADSMIFYDSFFKAAQRLNDEDRLAVYDAILCYGITGEFPDVDGIAGAIFDMAKPQIDANSRRREDGQKGGRPRKEEKPMVFEKPEKEKPMVFENDETEKPMVSENDENEKPNVNVNVNANVNDNAKKRESAPRSFSPPSVEEVRSYCQERKNGVNPEQFVDFYESKGWKIGKERMRDWKAAVRTWERRDETARSGTTKPVQFPQRDYDFDELERQLVRNG